MRFAVPSIMLRVPQRPVDTSSPCTLFADVLGQLWWRGIDGIAIPIGGIADEGKGEAGEQGIPGIQGIQGAKGDKGDSGIQGIQGLKGDSGIQGIQGPAGEAATIPIYGSGGLITGIREWVGIVTSDAQGLWIASITSAGFTSIKNVQATAVAPGAAVTDWPQASVFSATTSTITGGVSKGRVLAVLGATTQVAPSVPVHVRVLGT